MIRSKIDPSTVQDLTWKDYVKLFEKDVKQAQDKGLDKVPLIMISDFEFSCGQTHALLLLGKQSALNKFYKGLKTDSTRKKLKDFAIGFCHFDKEENGSHSMRLAIEGFGKPSKMKKNSKKLATKLGLNIKDIIKGQYTDEVVENIGQDRLNEEEAAKHQAMGEQAIQLKQDEDLTNDGQRLPQVAKAYAKAKKAINTHVVPLLLEGKYNNPVVTQEHIQIAEEAFRAAASLVDKYQEVQEEGKDLAKSAKKITALKEEIDSKQLVKKYERIWKKVQREYDVQIEGLSAPLREKFERLDQLLDKLSNLSNN